MHACIQTQLHAYLLSYFTAGRMSWSTCRVRGQRLARSYRRTTGIKWFIWSHWRLACEKDSVSRHRLLSPTLLSFTSIFFSLFKNLLQGTSILHLSTWTLRFIQTYPHMQRITSQKRSNCEFKLKFAQCSMFMSMCNL